MLFVPSLRRLSSVAVARSSLRPTVLISNPLVWVKLQDFLVPSAPGLKVPVGLGFSPTLLRAALPIRFPPLSLLGIFLDSNGVRCVAHRSATREVRGREGSSKKESVHFF